VNQRLAPLLHKVEPDFPPVQQGAATDDGRPRPRSEHCSHPFLSVSEGFFSETGLPAFSRLESLSNEQCIVTLGVLTLPESVQATTTKSRGHMGEWHEFFLAEAGVAAFSFPCHAW